MFASEGHSDQPQNPNEIPHTQPVSLQRYLVQGMTFELPTRYYPTHLIGQGAYGVVCSCEDRDRGTGVAIKKMFDVFSHDWEFQKRILREIKIMRHLNHQNIISLIDLIPPRSYEEFKDVYIVTDLMNGDLRQLVKAKQQQLTIEHVQVFMYQIFCGIKYMLSANILHRDIKPHNVLINVNCEARICDFGLARSFDFENIDSPVMSTYYLATRWYRAPEMLIESTVATMVSDVWSCGCILFELLSRDVLFKGKNRVHQLEVVVDMLGVPSNLHELNGSEPAKKFLSKYRRKNDIPLEDRLPPDVDLLALDLLQKIIVFDPAKRITVDEALAHPFFDAVRNQELETTCAKPMDFSFERELQQELINLRRKNEIDERGFTKSDFIKRMIYKEILEWNGIFK